MASDDEEHFPTKKRRPVEPQPSDDLFGPEILKRSFY